jgi:hypothetical protein
MCYGDPKALLEAALDAFPLHRERFEADFEHFCAYSGLLKPNDQSLSLERLCHDWARWAFWSAGDYNGSEK